MLQCMLSNGWHLVHSRYRRHTISYGTQWPCECDRQAPCAHGTYGHSVVTACTQHTGPVTLWTWHQVDRHHTAHSTGLMCTERAHRVRCTWSPCGHCVNTARLSLSLCTRVFCPNTHRHVGLLGPCFKTGHLRPLHQHPGHATWTEVPNPRGVVRSSSIPAIASIREAITHSGECHVRSRPSTTAEINADPSTGKYAQLEARLIPSRCD